MPRPAVLAGLVGVVLMAAGSVAQPPAEASTGAAGPRVEITSFASPVSGPWGIAVGPDGALWFTSYDSIGRITTKGKVTVYAHPRISPRGITAGPDGALWFTNVGDSIGRITTKGTVTVYTHPSIDLPRGITAGPDGALWFTNEFGDSIGRLRILKPR